MSQYNLSNRAYEAYRAYQELHDWTPLIGLDEAIEVFVDFYKRIFELDLTGKITQKQMDVRLGYWHCNYGKLTVAVDVKRYYTSTMKDEYKEGGLLFHLYYEYAGYYSPAIDDLNDIGKYLFNYMRGDGYSIEANRTKHVLSHTSRQVWELDIHQYNAMLPIGLDHELLLTYDYEGTLVFVVKFDSPMHPITIASFVPKLGGSK